MSDVPSRSILASPWLLFVTGTVLMLLTWVLAPELRGLMGVSDFKRWFLDSHAVLAASDAVRAGFDPLKPNPLDVFQRPHVYSDWWLGLGDLGLTREDNFLVGGLWVLGFLAALFLTVRPRSVGEALWLVLLAGSPPVMLGIIRANNDLVVFAVLALGLLALRVDKAWGGVLAVVAVAVATGLKFYPIAAGFVFLVVQPLRRRWLTTLAALVVSGAVLWSVRDQVQRGAFLVEPELYTMGARIWLSGFGVPLALTKVVTVGLLGLGAVWVVRRGWTRGLADENTTMSDRAMMTVGAGLLVFCFLATVNYGYRWIFALWLAPWLWERRRVSAAAKIMVWLLPVMLWQDAALSAVTEWCFAPMPQVNYDRALVVWHQVTQPLTWAAMILLTGWLLDLTWSRLREVGVALRSGRKS